MRSFSIDCRVKNIGEATKRFIKVIYVLLLLFGLLFTFWIYSISTPYSYNTYSYKVTCNNGKVFDPTSKPIDHSFDEPYGFNKDQLKSECEYGTAYYVGWSKDLPKNYDISYSEQTHVVTTAVDQIKTTLIAFVIYYIALEIIRRTVLYIFAGKPFINFRRKS